MNNDFGTAKQFEAAFAERLVQLTRKWGLAEEAFDNDPRLNEIRAAAKSILLRTDIDLSRLKKNSSYEKEHKPYFESLRSPDYQPTLYGLNILKGTSEHADAVKLLKDLAYHIGTSVSSQQEALAKAKEAIERAAAKEAAEIAAPPAEDSSVVSEASWEEWEQASITVPAELEGDDKTRFADEIKTISQIIEGASLIDVQAYIENTLGPRIKAINADLAIRRKNYQSDDSFALREAVLIDFQNNLNRLIGDAMIKAAPPTVELATPFPSLPKEEVVVTSPQLSKATQEKLNQTKENLETIATTRPADILETFINERLNPKIREVEVRVNSLKAAGNEPDKLLQSQEYLAVLETGRKTMIQKLADQGVRYIETLQDTIPPAPTVVATAAPVQEAQPKKPSIDEQLATIRQRIDNVVATKSGQELQSVYDTILKPKMIEIHREITRLKAEGNNEALLAIKQKHFTVIRDGAKAVHGKLFAEAEAVAAETAKAAIQTASARMTTEPLRIALASGASIPLSAIYPSAARASQEKDYPVAVLPKASNDTGTSKPVAQEYVNVAGQAAGSVKRLSAEAMADAKVNAKTVHAIGEKKPMPWWKKAAVVVAVPVAMAVAAFAGVAAKIAWTDYTQADARAARAAAVQAEFDKAAKNPFYSAPAASIIVATPANSVSPASVKADPVEPPKADAPVKAPVVDDTPKFAAAEPEIQKSAPKAAKVASKAKADFKPAAAVNDDNITYKGVIEAKPFDIATSRVDVQTWGNACDFLKANGKTVENGICPK